MWVFCERFILLHTFRMFYYIFCRISKVISLNKVVYVVGPRGRGRTRRRPLAAARACDAHLTDTVKQGQFRENDLKELNLS